MHGESMCKGYVPNVITLSGGSRHPSDTENDSTSVVQGDAKKTDTA
jgi:hypothetical protein